MIASRKDEHVQLATDLEDKLSGTTQTSAKADTQGINAGAAEVEDPDLMAAYGRALVGCLEGPREQVGERLVRAFLAFWENPQLRPQLIEVLRSAFASDAGAAMLHDFMSARLFAQVAEKLKVSQSNIIQSEEMLKVPPLNFNVAAAQVWGVIMLRYLLRLEPIASVSEDELVGILAPTIQHYLGSYSVPVSPAA